MLKHARNYERIYRSYNLPFQSRPGSDMAKAIEVFKAQLASWQKKLKRIQELEQRRLRRLERRSGIKPDAKEVRAATGPPAPLAMSQCLRGLPVSECIVKNPFLHQVLSCFSTSRWHLRVQWMTCAVCRSHSEYAFALFFDGLLERHF